MDNEEPLNRIANAADDRTQRRGVPGNHELENGLQAQRGLAVLPSERAEPADPDQSLPPQPDQTSGNPVPAPLAKEEVLRADDVKQSAEELNAGIGTASEKKSSVKPEVPRANSNPPAPVQPDQSG